MKKKLVLAIITSAALFLSACSSSSTTSSSHTSQLIEQTSNTDTERFTHEYNVGEMFQTDTNYGKLEITVDGAREAHWEEYDPDMANIILLELTVKNISYDDPDNGTEIIAEFAGFTASDDDGINLTISSSSYEDGQYAVNPNINQGETARVFIPYIGSENEKTITFKTPDNIAVLVNVDGINQTQESTTKETQDKKNLTTEETHEEDSGIVIKDTYFNCTPDELAEYLQKNFSSKITFIKARDDADVYVFSGSSADVFATVGFTSNKSGKVNNIICYSEDSESDIVAAMSIGMKLDDTISDSNATDILRKLILGDEYDSEYLSFTRGSTEKGLGVVIKPR